MNPKWLEWAQRLQAVAQNGLTFAKDPFDIERYTAMRELAVEILATYSGVEAGDILELFTAEKGYATPKLDVRGVVFQEGKLLMVKERSDGCWTLPGGWVDVGESPREAVVKEIHEESGYETQPTKLLAVYDRNKHGHPPLFYHVHKLFIRCELIGGRPAESLETSEVAFFGANEIPHLSLTRVVPSQITRFFEHYRHPEWPTDFD